MAAHESPRTTKLCDRTRERLTHPVGGGLAFRLKIGYNRYCATAAWSRSPPHRNRVRSLGPAAPDKVRRKIGNREAIREPLRELQYQPQHDFPVDGTQGRAICPWTIISL
jgi:hypothetical protein